MFISKGLAVLGTKNYQNRWTCNEVTIGWKVARFYESQQNATNLNISVSRGRAATYFRCGGQCYKSFCWKFNRLSSRERIVKIG